MNAITRQMVLMIAPMLIRSLINSMLNEQKLTEYRDKIVGFMRSQADRTSNEIDDMAIEEVIRLVLEPSIYATKTVELCALAKAYVKSTLNEWDDLFFLPILDRIEQIGTGK